MNEREPRNFSLPILSSDLIFFLKLSCWSPFKSSEPMSPHQRDPPLTEAASLGCFSLFTSLCNSNRKRKVEPKQTVSPFLFCIPSASPPQLARCAGETFTSLLWSSERQVSREWRNLIKGRLLAGNGAAPRPRGALSCHESAPPVESDVWTLIRGFLLRRQQCEEGY